MVKCRSKQWKSLPSKRTETFNSDMYTMSSNTQFPYEFDEEAKDFPIEQCNCHAKKKDEGDIDILSVA